MRLVQYLGRRPRPHLMLAGLGFLAAVGVVDYLTGFEIFFSVFYLLGVGLAAWYVGRNFGLLLSVLSVAVWVVGDWAAGARYSSPFIPAWNAMILLVFYFIVVGLLTSLRSLHNELENRVQQRTLALRQEIAERERLEKEILEISEREQRRIGHDLHDSLCQHLTGTALACQVLGEKLAAGSRPEAADANQLVELVEDGIALARNLARGICPVEMEAEGLMAAFRELAASVTKRSRIIGSFKCDPPVLIHDATTATHLYRIAQEAVTNAMRHGKPTRILICLLEGDGRLSLTVEDDGVGLSEGWQKGLGLGTHIMAHRAAMMSGSLVIEPGLGVGTVVRCSIPEAHGLKGNGDDPKHDT
jgi:signal transduction histidine kinase